MVLFSSLFPCLTGKKNRGTEWKYLRHVRVSHNTLLTATNRFSSANLIGVGTFGSVYKAVLVRPSDTDKYLASDTAQYLVWPSDTAQYLVSPSDTAQYLNVAVKVFNLLHEGASKTFVTECEAMRNIRHRNIVKTITACSSIDYGGSEFKALVYEFMENGSLEEWLHPREEVRTAPKNLDFFERLDIAIDVACALDYLHNHCDPPIVHCDMKPSNILLDNELTGRISDFGLAKFLSKVTNSSGNHTTTLGFSASVSYVAPEYKRGREASTYVDVYGFGILLLEMFTGKKPTDDMFSEDFNLHDFVNMALSPLYNVSMGLDPRLLKGDNVDANFSWKLLLEIEVSLMSIFRIGLMCSSQSPTDRMDMNDVVSNLQLTRDILKKLYDLPEECKIDMTRLLCSGRTEYVTALFCSMDDVQEG